jgi:hypothetical protein
MADHKHFHIGVDMRSRDSNCCGHYIEDDGDHDVLVPQ